MSQIYSLYTCNEVIVDDNGNFVKDYTENLPHHDQIIKTFCDAFNTSAKDHLLNILNKDVGDKIAAMKAKPYAKAEPGKTIIVVAITAKPNARFTEKLRTQVFDWISTQYSDGWGEGFFGPVNVLTADDGTRFYID